MRWLQLPDRGRLHPTGMVGGELNMKFGGRGC